MSLLNFIFRPQERTKIDGYVENIVPLYDADNFRAMFRMTRPTFMEVCSYLQRLPAFNPRPGGKHAISVDKQLLMTLWYLGCQENVNRVADRFGMSLSSVIRCRNRVLNSINTDLLHFIKWPRNEELQALVNLFSQRNGFPGIVGALDGTHIEIRKPENHAASYINRKQFYSLQLQAVCDFEMKFTHVFMGYPGSCHDARVCRNSDLWNNGPQMCGVMNHIIADAAYPLKNWLLTPYRDNGHLTAVQKRFNTYLSANRVVIERAFGLLKGRFRRLKYLDTELENGVDIILSCCILHNICLMNHEDVSEFLEQDIVDNDNIMNPPLLVFDDDGEAILKRNRIAANLV